MSNCLSLPLYPEMTTEQVDYVAETLAELLSPVTAGVLS